MVHSNGTRVLSQRFSTDRTGSKKYSVERFFPARGEEAARRAMPASSAGFLLRCAAQSGGCDAGGGGWEAAVLPWLAAWSGGWTIGNKVGAIASRRRARPLLAEPGLRPARFVWLSEGWAAPGRAGARPICGKADSRGWLALCG